MSYTDAQLTALAIVPKVTSVLSLIGSSIIMSDILAVYRGKRGRTRLSPRHRILAGMSFCDSLSSFGWFLTTWPIPSDISYTKWTVGTQATCTLQGFLVQLGVGAAIYSGCLAIYYFLVIRQGWSDDRICKCAEPIMHLISLGFTFGSAIAGVALTLYNPLPWGCWMIESPRGCSQSYQKQDEVYPCERGDNAFLYVYILYYGPVWITFIVLTTCMFFIYLKIKKQEQITVAYRSSNNNAKAFAFQASMYVGAFFMSWSAPTSASLTFDLTGKTFFWHVFVAIVLNPSQGFFNMMVYKLPDYQQYRRRKRRELTLRQTHHPTTRGKRTSYIRSSYLSVLHFFNSTNSNNNKNSNTLPNKVQEEDLKSEDENAADQIGEVDNEILGYTSLQEEQQQPSDSQHLKSEDENAADQTGHVDDAVSRHVHEQLPSTSFQKDQQPPSDSENATSEC